MNFLEWSGRHEFVRSGGTEGGSEQARRDLASVAFLAFVVQDRAHVQVALNNTFHRGKRFEHQFAQLPIRIGSQRFFEGFKLGMCYLWLFPFLGADPGA
jgi:hypothetical protein